MNYSLEQIEERVYALLDENKQLADELAEYCDPCTSLTRLIHLLAEESAMLVLSTAPAWQIDECNHYPPLSAESGLHRLPGTPGPMTQMMCTVRRNDQTGKTSIQLPDDFLRLLFFRMSDWTDGVTTPLACGGDECRLRMGARIGYRSHRHRPAVAVDCRGDKKFLEIFGSASGAYVAEFDYLTVPRIADGCIELPPSLFGEVCRQTADAVELKLGKRRL